MRCFCRRPAQRVLKLLLSTPEEELEDCGRSCLPFALLLMLLRVIIITRFRQMLGRSFGGHSDSRSVISVSEDWWQ
jgi:hypothetical protein